MWNKKKQINDRALKYPPWTFVRTNEAFYLLLKETMMEFISYRAFQSWNVKPIDVDSIVISRYKLWKRIGFAPGSKVEAMDGSKYIITGLNPIEPEACKITTPDLFQIGFDERDFIKISNSELHFHKRGEDIDAIEF